MANIPLNFVDFAFLGTSIIDVKFMLSGRRCCIHGKGGCLRIQEKYVCFPSVEQAKQMIKYFQANGCTQEESMDRYVPEDAYRCLNRRRPRDTQRRPHSLVGR